MKTSNGNRTVNKAQDKQGPLLVHVVKVRHALAAIEKRADERSYEIQKKTRADLQSIESDREELLQSMKNMQLILDQTVSTDKFDLYLAHEKKLFELHLKAIEPAAKEVIKELEEILEDSLQFFKLKFWDPIPESIEKKTVMMEEAGCIVLTVRVRHALAAIKRHADARSYEIKKKALADIESIESEREEIIQSMRNMPLKLNNTVPIEEFETYLAYEQKLFELHAKSLDPTVEVITEELEEMMKDSLLFFKRKFWDPIPESIEVRGQDQLNTRKPLIIALYAALVAIPFCIFYISRLF